MEEIKMADKKPVKITETILRDAHQSLIATRMPTEEMLPIIDTMDKVGYHLSLIHISEPTRLGMISYAVFCLKKKKKRKHSVCKPVSYKHTISKS